MARAFTTAQRNILAAARVNYYAYVEIENGSGTYIDYSNAGGVDWVVGGEILEDIDNPTATATVRLRRDVSSTLSLAPMLTTSTLNRDGGGSYSPAIDRGRGIRISIASVGPGATPVFDDKIRMFEGRIDVVSAESDPMVLECRDLGARLVDTLIPQIRDYGTVGGTALETILQQLITDNLAIGTPTLVASPSPGVAFTTRRVDQQQLMDALRTIAGDIGWDVRYRWTGATSSTLQLWQPNRTKTVPDWTVGPAEYRDVTRFAVSDEGRRTGVEVYFTDATTGQRDVRAHYDASYSSDPRLLQIELDETSNIDSGSEAQALADLIFSDLILPKAEQEVQCTLLWFVQLGDLGGFLANGVHYDSQQNLGVTGIRHTFEGGHAETFLRCRGNPAGAYAQWLLRQRFTDIPGLPQVWAMPAQERYDPNDVEKFIGWRVPGFVDGPDTGAVVVYATPGIANLLTVPVPWVSATGADGEDEYWIDTGLRTTFTVVVDQPDGGADELVFVPHELFNPGAAHPRPGKVGEEVRVPLERAPRTTADRRKHTKTLFQVVLTTRPTTATIRWRIWDHTLADLPVPVPWDDPWFEVKNADGQAILGDGSPENPWIDVGTGAKRLEFYGVSTEGAVEQVHDLRLDEDDYASGSVTLVEVESERLKATVTTDDDTRSYSYWARRGERPVLPNGGPDSFYIIVADRPRDIAPPVIEAKGDGSDPASRWFTIFRFYDEFHQYAQVEADLLIVGGGGVPPNDAALLDLRVAQDPSGGGFGVNLMIYWDVNSFVQAAAASAYKVKLYEDGVLFPGALPNAKTTGPAGVFGRPYDNTDVSLPWHTIHYVADLVAAGAPTVVLNREETWVVARTFSYEPLAAPPSTAPPAIGLTPGSAGSGKCTAAWATPSPTLPIEFEWGVADLVGGPYTTLPSIILDAGRTSHVLLRLDVPTYVRARSRYVQGSGASNWTAYATPVLCQTRAGVV